MHHNMVVNDKKILMEKMPYLVLPRFGLRENRKLAKPKFMFYQSLTRIWHNLQVHVESQIKNFWIFSYCRNIKNRSYRAFVIKQRLIREYSNYSIFKWCHSLCMSHKNDSFKFNEGWSVWFCDKRSFPW